MTGIAPSENAPSPPEPGVTASMVPNLRKLAPQVLVAGVLPVVAYALLRPHLSSDALALGAVMVFPIGEITFERMRHGQFEPIGIIALIGIGVGLVGTLAFNGDATLLKVRESLVTGVFGLVCLASLAAPRPAMFYLGRAFATGGDAERVAEFNQIWDLEGVPRRFRLVTVVWGAGLLGEAVVRTVLALRISTQRFLVIAQLLNWAVIGGLLWFSTAYGRAGERKVAASLAEVTVSD